MTMKKLLVFSYVLGMTSFSLNAQENTVTNDAELGIESLMNTLTKKYPIIK